MIALQIPDSTNLADLAHALREAGLAISPRFQRDGLRLQPLDRPRTPAARIRQAINATAGRRPTANREAAQ
jgi:uncharacterized protein with von Willebrand factor type A (vWA) domain